MQNQTVWADMADREADDVYPFRGLWALMISTAIKDMKSGNQSERDSALRWIEDEDPSHPLAFSRLCEVLGLDAGRARAKIAARYVKH